MWTWQCLVLSRTALHASWTRCVLYSCVYDNISSIHACIHIVFQNCIYYIFGHVDWAVVGLVA